MLTVRTANAAPNATIYVYAYANGQTLSGVSGTIYTGAAGQCPGKPAQISFTTNGSGEAVVGTGCDSTLNYCLSRKSISKSGYKFTYYDYPVGEDPDPIGFDGICAKPGSAGAGQTRVTFTITMEAVTSAPATPSAPATKPTTPSKPKSTTQTPQSPAADTTPPSKPADLKVSASKDAIRISWAASTDDVSSVQYTVERSIDNESWQPISQALSETTFTDTDVEPDTLYYYRVTAKDDAGNNSEVATVTGKVESANTVAMDTSGKPLETSKTSGVAVAGIVGVLVLLGAGGGYLLYRKRRTPVAPLQSPVMHPTIATPAAPEPHTSLKDMVLKDMDPNNSKDPFDPQQK